MVPSLFLILLLPLLAPGQDPEEQEYSFRLVSCMQIVRTQLTSNKDHFEALVGQSPFKREEVLTKYMGEMIVHCMKAVPMEVCEEVLREREGDTVSKRHSGYAPLPDREISSEEEMMLTEEEEIVLGEIMDRTKKAEEMRGKGGMQGGEQSAQPIGTSLGLIYILIVFLVFAGIVIYGIKRMNDIEQSKKDKKKKKT